MGVVGLGLALVGLYSLVAYAVTRRTRESASAWRSVRRRLGASPW